MDIERDYFLFLADVKGSSSLSGGKATALRRKLEAALEALNGEIEPKPLRGFSLNYGDEIAALFSSPEPLFEAARLLRERLRPFRFRFAVAQGRVGAATKDITQMGGAAFKLASEALDAAKKQDRFCRWRLKDSAENRVLNALVEMSDAIVLGMTDYQHQVYQALRHGEPQVDIAARLGKAPQSVSKAARSGGARLAIEAEEAILAVLARMA